MSRSAITRRALVRNAAHLGIFGIAERAVARVAAHSPAGAIVYVGPGSARTGDGTPERPFNSIDAALDAIRGEGAIRLLAGQYGAEARIDPGRLRGRVSVSGIPSGGAYPLIRLGDRLSGVARTSGRRLVYQAKLAGLAPEKLNWLWQDDVPDARTRIADGDRHPLHAGRLHRLPSTRILRLRQRGLGLAAALDQLEAAREPRCYYEQGILYFTVQGGGDATKADLYVPDAEGLIARSPVARGAELVLEGLDVRYGGLDLRGLARAEVHEARVLGAALNGISYSGPFVGSAIECGGAGSLGGGLGDGLNGHGRGAAVVSGYYGHDCYDDGESNHDEGSTRMRDSLLEYNGGAGAAPAYGAQAEYENVISRRNQRRKGRKPGGFAVVGAAKKGPDTRATFTNCTSIGDRTGFFADPAGRTYGDAIGCKAIDPEQFGFVGMRLTHCSHAGTGIARGPGVTTLGGLIE